MLEHKFEISDILFLNGVDIRYENDEVFKCAVLKRDLEACKYLIKNGADIHFQNE